ncbi:Flp family type IVb pilin [Vibrio hannami]|uniref:Flp family type IVb pilin n=1 Tax=Vibrio hannami TaxID=2717094 RepID=UPI0024104345|nr:Flp family type IVb pilin [Vibrio hannami]MDG3085982.1 Flp family type IVb pilin [Vibrio hannami]
MLFSICVKARVALEKFKNDERGVTAIEYAVIGGAIAGVLLLFFGTGGGDTGITAQLTAAYDNLLSALGGSRSN